MTTAFDTYLARIQADYKGGKATEYTYRSALEHLLEELHDHVEASNDPKHIACGAPDFIVERRKVILGYVETKDIGEDLDKVEESEQLKRYRESLHNLILTDYLEFRWYVNGEKRLTARIATEGRGKKLQPDAEGLQHAAQLLTAFYTTDAPITTTPKDLAQRMAALTRLVRDLIVNELFDEQNKGVLFRQWQAFRDHLLPALSHTEFADLYAQTMAYGLFAARINAPEGKPFDRAQAYVYLPPANPFLRKLFNEVGEELDGTVIAPFLDDLARLLKRADMREILQDFGKRTRTEDPVVHFYETFLAAYDPALRESRGVYYTPEPVVQFIVNSVDQLLRTHFHKPTGLADPDVLLLDPATGTGTFLYYVIKHIHATQRQRGQAGLWANYVEKHLLPRVFGFELLMAPYAIAHLKLGLLLNELGYTFGKHERLSVFLTNTLDKGVTKAQTLGLAGYLSDEGSAASVVKNYKPIMVVLGNPPYSGHSANASRDADGHLNFIGKLVNDYYFVDGAPLGERNPKWLQDDYVKFIRYAQSRIQETGYGVVGFITNHGYLDNPTFRGMRQHLLKTFDELYVLDLHGNSKKKETAPDGGKDENVFDIQQGVAILLAVKQPTPDSLPGVPQLAQVRHAHLYGLREGKYAFLAEHDVRDVDWTAIQPTAPFYLFVPQNTDLRSEYEHGWKLTDVVPENLLGFQTHRDPIAIGFNESSLRTQISEHLGKTPTRAEWQEYCHRCDYRPFDSRLAYFDKQVSDRPRLEITRHLFQPNIALNVVRQTKAETWQHALASAHPTPAVFVEIKDGSSIFPLYLYTTPEETQGTFWAQSEVTRTPNLAPEFIKEFSSKLGLVFVEDGKGDLKKTYGPEDVFAYIYAIFHSPTYRTRYAEFLKIDFPRVPLTGDVKLFRKLVDLGAELVDLHLMRSPKLNEFITTYPISGSNEVVRVRYAPSPENRRASGAGVGAVWINDTQYFGGVPETVWAFKVGGYQVCDKWLKDRKGRTLNSDDLMHYQRIVVALKETMRLMAAIDKAIPGWPLA